MILGNLLNVKNNDIEKIIKSTIKDVNEELDGLHPEQTCLIYSSYVYRALKNVNINARIINTVDLGFDYRHFFTLVPDNKSFYIIDLTFSQFNNKTMPKLLKDGYQEVNDQEFNKYLDIVTKEHLKDYFLDEVYLGLKGMGGR